MYSAAKQRNLRKINSYSSSTELNRWDKLIAAYNTLQEMHDAIVEVDAASQLVTPINYHQTIYNTKRQAAADYYAAATVHLNKPGRADAKQAYTF